MLTLSDINFIPRVRDVEQSSDSFAIESFEVANRYFTMMAADVAEGGPAFALGVALGVMPAFATMVFETNKNGDLFGMTEDNPDGDPPLVKIDSKDFEKAKVELLYLLNNTF